jgi:AcrR family transcriptional regulator
MNRIIKKPEERRREIVSASRTLFLKKGYENTTMQHVMTKLQIAKGTAYHYFRSKEELLEAVVEDMAAEYVGMVENLFNKAQGNALEKLTRLIEAGRAVAPSLDELHRSDNRNLHARLLAVTIMKLAPLYARVIEQGCAEGVFRVEHPLECAEMVLAGIQFITDTGCHPWARVDLERRARAIPYLVETQLNAPKNSINLG